MPNPQQEELRRSGNVPALNPDAVEAARTADRRTENEAPAPVPPDQRPGHQPERDQDKPDLDAFADAIGVPSDDMTSLGATRNRPSTRTVILAAVGVGLAGAVAWAVTRRMRRR